MTAHAPFVTATQRALLAEERALLNDLRVALARLGAGDSSQVMLAQSLRQLDGLFLLVVVGEFNAGKSALVNALLGVDLLPEGVTPTTARITLVRHGDPAETKVTPEGIVEVTAPIDMLRELHVVDTPGTNAVLREHEAVTTEFVPRADLVLSVTSADRPFTESERQFLGSVRAWGKKIVFVVNKVDILEGQAQVDEVVAFVVANASTLLGDAPVVFPVSARLARQGRGDEARWQASGLAAVDRFVTGTLDDRERLKLKLRNPVGVARRVSEALRADIAERLAVLHDDRQAVDQTERQLQAYGGDMARDFEFRWADIEKVLFEMERRGHDHFDESIRLGRIRDLLDRSRVKADFERVVVADVPHRLEQKVNGLIDWMVDADFQQWQSITQRLAERRAAGAGAAGHAVTPTGFHQDRARLVDSVGREAQRVVETYDRSKEAADLAEKARASVATSAAIEVGAAGLGAVIAAVASTASADITGFAMAGVLATLGLLVIPHRRRQAKEELRRKVTDLRERLGRSLRTAFEDEQGRSLSRLRQGLDPYARFVRAESAHLAGGRDEIDRYLARMREIDGRIDTL